MSIVAFDKSTPHFVVRNKQYLPLLSETNNAFRIVTQTYFISDHTIDFCAVKVFMVLLETKKEFLKLTKCPLVRNEYIPTNNASFVVRNGQRFPLLLETNNASRIVTQTYTKILMFLVFVSFFFAFRIFRELSETKSALVIKISQLYCLFIVWNSDVFSIVSSSDSTFFFRAT